ncbi:hypothetical protein [Gilliamella sp. Bif1-4]|uniref:hypothetical protein n=1 Tax=Gilliamella sp. Bif1-4 TaxID=3120233 RepID=UPI00080EE491|nr:hypothetical protein [Gilliamella apicola]OCG42985.1 hypothetical protein A9G25_00685 [Gilliamella apicola]
MLYSWSLGALTSKNGRVNNHRSDAIILPPFENPCLKYGTDGDVGSVDLWIWIDPRQKSGQKLPLWYKQKS